MEKGQERGGETFAPEDLEGPWAGGLRYQQKKVDAQALLTYSFLW